MDILRVFKLGGDKGNELVYGITDSGKRRNNNEDCYLLLPERGIYVVADGMGGQNSGEVASQNAVETIGRYFSPKRMLEMRYNKEKIPQKLIQAVTRAHEKILEISETKEKYYGMGSTIVVSFIHNKTLHTCHVGDSRAYIINASGITQVTNDHSTVAEMVRNGNMTSEEARRSPLKGEITQALGSPAPINPEYNQRDLNVGDMVLLCSDGLWEMLSDGEIRTIVTEQENVKAACKELTNQANEAGGRDNITVILIQID